MFSRSMKFDTRSNKHSHNIMASYDTIWWIQFSYIDQVFSDGLGCRGTWPRSASPRTAEWGPSHWARNPSNQMARSEGICLCGFLKGYTMWMETPPVKHKASALSTPSPLIVPLPRNQVWGPSMQNLPRQILGHFSLWIAPPFIIEPLWAVWGMTLGAMGVTKYPRDLQSTTIVLNFNEAFHSLDSLTHSLTRFTDGRGFGEKIRCWKIIFRPSIKPCPGCSNFSPNTRARVYLLGGCILLPFSPASYSCIVWLL